MPLLPLPELAGGRGPGVFTLGLIAVQILVLFTGTGPAMAAALRDSFGPVREIILEYGVLRDSPGPGNLFTSLFVHAGLVGGWIAVGLHLLLLFILGGDLERRAGGVLFIGLYVVGGALGALMGAHLTMMASPPPTLASTSALGAIMGAHFILCSDRRIHVAFLALGRYRPLTRRVLPISPLPFGIWTFPARVALPICLVLVGVASFGMMARTAYLPGAFLGAVFAQLLRRLDEAG